MARRLIGFAAAAFGLQASPAAAACEITRLLDGASEAAEVKNTSWDGETYATYVVRNSARDSRGVLNNWIKLELIPQRWGFDLRLPNGNLLATVNTVDHEWVITAFPAYAAACASNSVTLKRGSADAIDVWDRRRRIGSIRRFPIQDLIP